jgi:hypothetical protein
MASYKEIEKVELFNQLKNDFPLKEIRCGELTFGGTIPLLFVKFNSLDDLNKHWKDFNSKVTTDYIIHLKEEYSRWNFYIFYFSENNVPKTLKYEIENNKFSSRKIVIENCETITEPKIKNVISEHITNDNIQINVENKQISIFTKSTTLEKILEKISLNKKNEDDLQNALNQIEKTYRDEI